MAAGNTIVRDPGGGVVIASSTYAPGQTARITGGTPLSVGSDHVIVGGSSYALPPTSPTAPAPIAAHSIIRASDGGIVIGSSTIAPGQQASVAGHIVSAGPSVALVDGSTYALAPSAGAIVQAPPASPSPSPLLVAGQSAVKATNGGLIVGSSTIAPGSEANVAGHTISVGSSQAVVDGSTYALPSSNGAVLQVLPTPPPVLDAGQSIVRASNGGVVIGSSTIAPGQHATVAGHTISVGSSVAAVDGTTYALPTSPGAVLQQAPNLAQNLAASSVVTLANGAVISAGGSPATVDGTVVAIPSGDSGLVVNGKAMPLPTAAPNSIFTVAGQTFTVAPAGFSLAGQFVSPGGLAITLSGTVVSLGPSGLQIGTSTMLLPSVAQSVFTVAGQTFTAAPTGFAIGSQSLSVGGSAITLSGTIISLGISGLQIGTSTVPLSPPMTSIFTVADQTFTATPTGFAIGSQTLTEGGSAITLAGTVISLGPSGLQIGTSTVPLTPAEASSGADASLGGLIMGGLGNGPSSTTAPSNGSGPVAFTGAGSRGWSGSGTLLTTVVVGVSVGLIALVL